MLSNVRRALARPGLQPWLLVGPVYFYLFLLFVVPLAFVLFLSVSDPVFSFSHYTRIFSVPLYTRVMLNTFQTSIAVTLICLLLGYPLAYVMARRDDMLSLILLAVVTVSFWTGFLVRTYAWLVILGNRGPVIGTLKALGVDEPPRLLFSSFGSFVGLVHILLPFMTLSLYGVMKKIDPNHLRAAMSLGARPVRAFAHVFLPLSMPGVVNGTILVFTICLGFYVTPILLGSPRDMMISQLINQQIEQLLAWGFASALAVVLLLATITLLAVYNRYAGLDRV